MFRILRGFYLLRRLGFRKSVHVLRHLPAYFRLYVRLMKDPRTPVVAKGLVIGALLYVLSPLDFLPDIVPFLGQMDDLALLMLALQQLTNRTPAHVRHEHEVASGLSQAIPVRVRRTS